MTVNIQVKGYPVGRLGKVKGGEKPVLTVSSSMDRPLQREQVLLLRKHLHPQLELCKESKAGICSLEMQPKAKVPEQGWERKFPWTMAQGRRACIPPTRTGQVTFGKVRVPSTEGRTSFSLPQDLPVWCRELSYFPQDCAKSPVHPGTCVKERTLRYKWWFMEKELLDKEAGDRMLKPPLFRETQIEIAVRHHCVAVKQQVTECAQELSARNS